MWNFCLLYLKIKIYAYLKSFSFLNMKHWCCNLKDLLNAFFPSKAENDSKHREQTPIPMVYMFVSLCHLRLAWAMVSTCLAAFCNCLPLVQWTEFRRQKPPSDLGWGWVPHSCSSPIVRARPSLWGPWVMQDGICGQRIGEELWAWVLPPLPPSFLFPILPL